MHYICDLCAHEHDIKDVLHIAINEVGRKACAWCGDNQQDPLGVTDAHHPDDDIGML